MDGRLVYELPLNERARLFLKLEHLFTQSQRAVETGDYWDAQLSMSALCDILTLLDRIDIRSELLQELDKLACALSRLGEKPGVDPKAFIEVLKEIKVCQSALKNFSLKNLPMLTANDFLSQLKQRLATAKNTLSFDCPAYHHWLHLPPLEQRAQLKSWLESLAPLENGVSLVLHLIRYSSTPIQQQAEKGLYQKQFDKSSSVQIVQVYLPESSSIYPEISGNTQRLNIRFLNARSNGARPEPAQESIDFELSCCEI